MCGREGMYGGGGHVWQGGVDGRGHAWQGACMAGGMLCRGRAWQGACMAGALGRYYEIRSMSRWACY